MTEEEARKRWCPYMAPVLGKDGLHPRCGQTVEYNRGNIITMTETCIASDCMMWAWDEVEGTTEGSTFTKKVSVSIGHCGLAK